MIKKYIRDRKRLEEIRLIKVYKPAPKDSHIQFQTRTKFPAYISPEDEDLIAVPWYTDVNARVKRVPFLDGKKVNIYLHKIVAKRLWPEIDSKCFIDHIDGNPSNNVRSNLRQSSFGPNGVNRHVTQNSTGILGVFINKGRYKKPFRASFKNKHKDFNNIEEARLWRNEQIDKYWELQNV